MKKADLASACVVAAFGVLLLAWVVPTWVVRHEEGGYGLGARVMPDVTAGLVTALAVLFFLHRFLRRREPGDEPSPVSPANWRFLGLTSLYLIAMTLLFDWVGFLATGPLTIAGFMVAMGERRAIAIIATSVLAAGAIWLFFWQLLRFPLP